jgi:hypothetical protein
VKASWSGAILAFVVAAACAPSTASPSSAPVVSSATPTASLTIVTASPTLTPVPSTPRPTPTATPWATLTKAVLPYGGNNAEAEAFAREIVAQGAITGWKMLLELQPATRADTISQYRAAVRTFSAWVIVPQGGIDDWKQYDDPKNQVVSPVTASVTSLVSVAHRGGTLQSCSKCQQAISVYYPNASVHVVFLAENGRVLATGDYDKGSDTTTFSIFPL